MNKNALKTNLKEVYSDFISLCKWLFIASIVGLIVSAVTTLFAYSVNLVNTIRNQHLWLLYMLPLAGLIIVGIYKLCGFKKDPGINLVISSINNNKKVPLRMVPLIFISTILTHLCGGSTGRTGAALQIGGSIGNSLSNVYKFDDSDKKVFTMCGMSAAFATILGTPMAAAIFAIEVGCVGAMYYSALVPCIFSALISSSFSMHFGIHPEYFKIQNTIPYNIPNVLKTILIAIICAAVSSLFCYALHKSRIIFNKLFENQFIRIFAGAVLVIIINSILQTTDYFGAGIPVILRAMDGKAVSYAFLLKILLTAITMGAGFKGGEIVPSLFIGATLGCVLGNILGISPSQCAALGMIGIFCGVTNCPITSALISFELFGYKSISLFLIIVSISYMMSGYNSLYDEQNLLYKKTKAVDN